MSRIVLAVGLIFFSAEAVRADDDFKTCATGAPDYAIMACTNLIEGGKLDIAAASHRLYQSRCRLSQQGRA